MKNPLPFEKPIAEMEIKIQEFETESRLTGIDLTSSLDQLKKDLEIETKRIFDSLSRWETVQVARHIDRPKTIDFIKFLIPDYVFFCGDRLFHEDPAIFGAMGTFENQNLMIIGHNKGKDTKENILCNFGCANPEGYRKALRLMRLAEKFHAPIVTIIDTQGANPGIIAEENGQSEAIARNLKEMFSISVPIIAIVIGEGGSGGALGIGVGDKIYMMEHSMYSVISPEGCASILFRDSSKAQLSAEELKLTAKDLFHYHLIDAIIPEPIGGAHRDPKMAMELVKDTLSKNLSSLKKLTIENLLEFRYQKYRKLASFEAAQEFYG
jgi:acetyl-CoA carboxylase carboxyl transferase subunit alpha